MITLNYFKILNNEFQEYFLGLLASDGCIRERKNKVKKPAYIIQFSSTDEELTDMICTKFNSTKTTYNSKHSNHKPIYITSIRVHEDFFNYLNKLGITPNKSLTLEINEQLIESNHFLRGIFDGDGHFQYRKGYREIEICTASEKFKNQLSFMLSRFVINVPNKFTNIENEVRINYDKRGNGLWKVSISRKETIKNFYDNVYKDANYFLARKKYKMRDSLGV